MARKFLDDVRAEVQSLFPDNTTALISPEDLRTVFDDCIDSIASDELGLKGTTPVIFNTTPSYQVVPNLYTEAVGGDLVYLVPDLPTQSFSCLGASGFSYTFGVQIACVGAANEPFSVAIFQDEVILRATDFITFGTQGGGIRVININLTDFENSVPNGSVLTARIAGISSGELTINSASFSGVVLATNNP